MDFPHSHTGEPGFTIPAGGSPVSLPLLLSQQVARKALNIFDYF